MKQLILFCMLLCSFNAVFSQVETGIVCGIYIDYDANGCRIKRYNDCKDYSILSHGPKEHLNPVLYPNPTNGPIIVSYEEMIDQLTLKVYDMSGIRVLLIVETQQRYQISADLSPFAPGTYVVKVEAIKEQAEYEDDFTVIRIE